MTKLIVTFNNINDYNRVIAKIASFYINAKTYKYQHAYGWDDALNDICKAESNIDFSLADATTKDWQNKKYIPIRNEFGWCFGCIKGKEGNNEVYFIKDAENCKNLDIPLNQWKHNNSTNNISKKDFKILRTKPLFGYRFVLHNKTKEYNLVDKDDKLVTQWFTKIYRPFKEPYGPNKVIAYVNIKNYAYALMIDGQVHSLDKKWENFIGENISNDEYVDKLNEKYYKYWYSLFYSLI